jgi:hypothetical protein
MEGIGIWAKPRKFLHEVLHLISAIDFHLAVVLMIYEVYSTPKRVTHTFFRDLLKLTRQKLHLNNFSPRLCHRRLGGRAESEKRQKSMIKKAFKRRRQIERLKGK